MSTSTVSCDQDGRKGEIMKMGYLRKLKTMKKKFFILRAESSEASARLEYYDSEKKWRSLQPPKRTISLKTCFNINRRRDTKHKFVIALYTKDDCFCLVLDTEEELQEWLKILLTLQTGEDVVDGEPPKPTFEHVWKVTMQAKGLGDSKNLLGPYHVCLTDKTLSLVKIERGSTDGVEEKLEALEIPLMCIRSCGVTGSFVYIELGRQAVTGAGALWMLTEDANIAKNMNSVIFSAFRLKQKDQVVDGHRKRSSSATESSKPLLFLQRRQTHGGSKPLIPTGFSEESMVSGHTSKLRPEHNQATPTDQSHAVPVSSSLALPALPRGTMHHYASRPPSQRRHSVSAMSSSSSVAHQLRPASPMPPVSHQRTKSCPVTDTPLDTPPPPFPSLASSHSSEYTRRDSLSGRRPSNLAKSTGTGTRERSDSMPSRERTTSEGTHQQVTVLGAKPCAPPTSRPHSMHARGLSYSPPMASGPCSTDSAGSSLSIDDGDVELVLSATSPRYGHSSTPDEPAIIEEIPDDCDSLLPDTVEEETDEARLHSLPIHGSLGGAHRKISAPASFKSSSPLSSYTDTVDSPCDYVPMSPAYPRSTTSTVIAASHSRTSSLIEETVDGYVPMAPNHTDDGYVDMDPVPSHRLLCDDGHPSDMSPSSSCSVTSCTPSTDMRFSEFHLEKVSSYFTPSEDEEVSSTGRPARTYSFGSQAETQGRQAGKVELTAAGTDSGRVRAFSVGSKWNKPRNLMKDTHKVPSRIQAPQVKSKSSSAPLLSSSWSGTSRHVQSALDPMADLMMIDFRDRKKHGSRFKVTPVMEAAPLNVDLKGAITSSADSGYMDMSSAYPVSNATSPPRLLSGSPRNAFGRSPPRSFPLAAEPGTKSLFSPPASLYEPKNSRLTKPAIISSTTLKTIGEKPDIKPQKFPTTSSANLNMFALPNKPYAPGNSPRSSVSEDYMVMESKSQSTRKVSRAELSRSTPEGYVEMSYGSGGSAAKLTRKSSSTSFNSRDDYMPMSAGKSCSQPITIRSVSKGTVLTSPVARKSSSTTPPKNPPNYLACTGSASSCSPLSSMRRSAKRKNRRKHERRGSKENVTTPTGSNSAIFPLSLSSPLSPKKAFGKEVSESSARSPESPLDESPYTEMSYQDEDSPYAEMTPGVELEDRPYSEIFAEGKDLSVPLSRVLRISSMVNSPSPTSHDYVNFAPSSEETAVKPVPTQAAVSDEFGDYAVMRPTATVEKKASYLGRSTANCPLHVSSPLPHKPPETVECESSGVSRQVSTSSCSSVDLAVKLTGDTHSGVSRQVSTSSSSSTEVASLKEGSSPRPSSVSSERDITYASLDLAPSGSEGEDSARSPRVAQGSSPSPNPAPGSAAFTYAEIDFEKSESLRAPQSFPKKIRH